MQGNGYRIIESEDTDEVCDEVKQALDQGWQLVGGMNTYVTTRPYSNGMPGSYYVTYYVQAISFTPPDIKVATESEFRILSYTGAGQMEQEVNRLLKEGWCLHGVMDMRTEHREQQLPYKSYNETIYTQAMVK